MAVDVEPITFEALIRTAVANVRSARHHQDCRCALFRPASHAPYCSSMEFVASSALDRILNARPVNPPCSPKEPA